MNTANIKVELVDVMGSDLTVVNAARVSMDKFHKCLKDGDEGLIKYLAQNNHWSPFAHAQMQFRIKAPIFVARQLVKHQVGLAWNEVSRRYVDSEPEFYIPAFRARAENVKQGSMDEEIPGAESVERTFMQGCREALSLYKLMLELGVAPETARAALPLSMMTEWIWTGSLYAFARVLNLRLDPHAQAESREVAEKMGSFIKERFPLSFKYLVKEQKK